MTVPTLKERRTTRQRERERDFFFFFFPRPDLITTVHIGAIEAEFIHVFALVLG